MNYSKDSVIKVGGKIILPDNKKMKETFRDKVTHIKLSGTGGEICRETVTKENGEYDYGLRALWRANGRLGLFGKGTIGTRKRKVSIKNSNLALHRNRKAPFVLIDNITFVQ